MYFRGLRNLYQKDREWNILEILLCSNILVGTDFGNDCYSTISWKTDKLIIRWKLVMKWNRWRKYNLVSCWSTYYLISTKCFKITHKYNQFSKQVFNSRREVSPTLSSIILKVVFMYPARTWHYWAWDYHETRERSRACICTYIPVTDQPIPRLQWQAPSPTHLHPLEVGPSDSDESLDKLWHSSYQ